MGGLWRQVVNRVQRIGYQTPPEVLAKIREAERTKATELDLSNSGLKEIPEELSRLQNLTSLYLSRNQLTEIPEHLSRLQNLTTLYLLGNQLTEIPEHLSQLQNLTLLGLSNNQLTEIPEHLSRLQNLTELYLSFNRLTEIPEHLSRLQNLTLLDLRENPIATPPMEICNWSIDAIRDYYRQRQEAGTAKLYEAKLLIVGEAGAGKTTLAQKIQNPDYALGTLPSTEGIDILRWQFELPDGSPFRVNIWDFGGQEIYHATHQFFLTKRSCYALVADNRKEDDNLYYWLSIIELLANDSPALIVKNEKGDRTRDLNENKLRGEFPQLIGSLAANLSTNRDDLLPLLDQIRHQLATLPHIGDELPATWVRVRDALETDPRNTLSLETYLQLCTDNGFNTRADALQLGQYLHDLGVFLHFQDDDLLIKTIILKPTWGTDAVYKVLDNNTVIQNQGCFSRDDLARIWSDAEYAGLQGELLQLMMKFQLCYELPNRPKHYIAPQLLSPNQPRYDWNDAQNLILRYTYEFMPKGILTRFIVALHKNIATDSSNSQLVWRTGVLLTKDNTLAEVSEFYEKRELKIRLSGSNKRGLLEIVTHELDKIHDSFHRLKYQQLIPCNCDVCRDSQDPHPYRLDILKNFISNNQSEIQCQKGFGMVDVYGLIDDIGDRSALLRDRPRDRPTPTPAPPMPDPTPEPDSTLAKFLATIQNPQIWIKVAAAVLIAAGASQVLPPGEDPPVPSPTPTTETAETAEQIAQEIYVYDSSNDEPLSGVDVRFLAPGGVIEDRTNSDGFTELTVPRTEDIDIELRKDGYAPQAKKLNLVTDAERRKTYYLKPN
jgi:internalin A